MGHLAGELPRARPFQRAVTTGGPFSGILEPAPSLLGQAPTPEDSANSESERGLHRPGRALASGAGRNRSRGFQCGRAFTRCNTVTGVPCHSRAIACAGHGLKSTRARGKGELPEVMHLHILPTSLCREANHTERRVRGESCGTNPRNHQTCLNARTDRSARPCVSSTKAEYSDHCASMGRQCESTQNSSARLYEPRFFLVFSCRKSLPLTLSSVSLAFLPHESA